MRSGQLSNRTVSAKQPILGKQGVTPTVLGGSPLDRAHRGAMARVAGGIRQMEQRVQAVPQVGQSGCFLPYV